MRRRSGKVVNELPGETLTNFKRIPPILWQSAPGWTIASTILLLLEIILGLLSLYLIKTLIDAITTTLSTTSALTDNAIETTTQNLTQALTNTNLDPILWQVGLLAAATLSFLAVRSLSALAREAQSLAVVDHIDRQIHQAAVTADLSFYESPQYFDTLQRARQSGTQRPATVATNALMLIKNALMLTAIIALMMSIDWRLIPILTIAILPALWVRVHFTQRLYDWKKRRTEMERRAGYLDWLMTSDLHAKELRLNQLGDYLKTQYAQLKSKIRGEQLKLTRQRTWMEMTVALAASAVFFLALGYLTYQTAQGSITVGDLVLFLLIFQRAQAMSQEIVNQISKLYEDHLYLGLLFQFLDLKPQLTALNITTNTTTDTSDIQHPAVRQPIVEQPTIQQRPSHQSIPTQTSSIQQPLTEPKPVKPIDPPRIEFKAVSFTYPGTDREVLSEINFTLEPGNVVALVGANGSGKTSLIKLLTRLYDPTQGKILMDGADIRTLNPECYRRHFSVVFQDFACYADSVVNNIRFGDIDLTKDSPSIQAAAERAQADQMIQALPQGYETMLSRMFQGGVDLSRGQWQKIALARAFVERAQIVVLDEPSSALDPNAEAELFDDFKAGLNGRSALLIAHRLSTIRMADWIYVLDEGRMVEEGDHETLSRAGGVYARAFERQLGLYYR